MKDGLGRIPFGTAIIAAIIAFFVDTNRHLVGDEPGLTALAMGLTAALIFFGGTFAVVNVAIWIIRGVRDRE